MRNFRNSRMKLVILVVLATLCCVGLIMLGYFSYLESVSFVKTYSQHWTAIRTEETSDNELFIHYLCQVSEPNTKVTLVKLETENGSYQVLAVFGNDFDCLLYVNEKTDYTLGSLRSGMYKVPSGVDKVTLFNHHNLVTSIETDRH